MSVILAEQEFAEQLTQLILMLGLIGQNIPIQHITSTPNKFTSRTICLHEALKLFENCAGSYLLKGNHFPFLFSLSETPAYSTPRERRNYEREKSGSGVDKIEGERAEGVGNLVKSPSVTDK